MYDFNMDNDISDINKSTFTSIINDDLNNFHTEGIACTGKSLTPFVEKEGIGDSSFEVVAVKEEHNDLPWTVSMENKIMSTATVKMEPKLDEVETAPFSKDVFMYKQEKQEPDLICQLEFKSNDKDCSLDFLYPETYLDRYEDSHSKQRMTPVTTESTEILEEVIPDIGSDEWKIKNEVVDFKEEGLQQNELIISSNAINHENQHQYKCQVSEYETKWKSDVNKHLIRLTSPANNRILICEHCEYKTPNEHNLQLHISRNHKTIEKVYKFTCTECNYRAVKKNHWKVHLLGHKNIEEVDASDKFQCGQCDYQTLYRSSLKKHLLRHTNIGAINPSNKFECDQCEYQTIEKSNLKQHILRRHKNQKETNTFKCIHCDYRTPTKINLKKHLLRHKNIEEVDAAEKFVCSECEYQTLYKNNFKNHIMLRHRKIEDIETFKCNQCDYTARLKDSIQRHLRQHRIREKINLVKSIKCTQCEYRTHDISYLKRHSLRHKNREELDLFKCAKCNYQTIQKNNLKRHLLRHMNREESNFFKCTQCDYQTHDINNLKRHCLRHKNPKEVDVFKCTQCEYQTLTKSNFKLHLLRHEKTSLLQCAQCEFRTISKLSFKKHRDMHT